MPGRSERDPLRGDRRVRDLVVVRSEEAFDVDERSRIGWVTGPGVDRHRSAPGGREPSHSAGTGIQDADARSQRDPPRAGCILAHARGHAHHDDEHDVGDERWRPRSRGVEHELDGRTRTVGRSIPDRIAATSARLDATEATDDLAELGVAPAVRRQRHLARAPLPVAPRSRPRSARCRGASVRRRRRTHWRRQRRR